jgi:hypothetical protein
MYGICENNAMCYLCDGERLYKKPKWMVTKEKQEEKKRLGIRKKKKEGMDFEKRVAKKHNKAKSSDRYDDARRRPNSGAIWSLPGDIVTKDQLIECKERGSTTSRGEKTISIPKAHLDKVKEEAYMAKKDIWYYIFSYKGSDEIYLVKDYDDELRMIQEIEELKDIINKLQKK